jgi:hypothetical protein
MHVSYHKDGRINHNSDSPGKTSAPIKWDFWGEMEPMIGHATPIKDIVGRQKVAVTGWETANIEKAGLPEFVPKPGDIVIEPVKTTTGFLVNIVSAGTPARKIGHLGFPVLARYELGMVPLIEIEVFDYSAPQAAAQRLVKSVHMITPEASGTGWLLNDFHRFETFDEAVSTVIAEHGMPHAISGRNDAGINLCYQRIEDDPFDL